MGTGRGITALVLLAFLTACPLPPRSEGVFICTADGDCTAGMGCAPDGTCRLRCKADSDCGSNVCVGGYCTAAVTGASSSSGGPSSSSSSTGGSSGMPTPDGGHGPDGGSCDVATCPAPPHPCQRAACVAGTCGTTAAPTGANCGGGQVCNSSGECVLACVINGVFVGPGVDEPGNSCRACNPAEDTSNWSPKANGTSCADDLFCDGVETCQEGTCVSAPACSDPTPHCDEARGLCAACLEHPDCPPDRPFCDPASLLCAACLTDTDCTGDTLFCTGEPACTDGMCGERGNPCEASGQSCSEEEDRCVECVQESDCPMGLHCLSTDGTCRACLLNSHCADDGLACNGVEVCREDNTCGHTNVPACTGTRPACEEPGTCVCTGTSCPAGYTCDGIHCVRSAIIPLANDGEDGYQDPLSSNSVLGATGAPYNWMTLGSSNHVGAMRYVVPIPRNAVITNARVRMFVDSLGEDNANVRIHAQATDNAPGLAANAANDVTNRPKTTASVHWLNPDMLGSGNTSMEDHLEAGTWVNSADFSAVIQEVINQPNWNPNNAVLLIFTPQHANGQPILEWRQREHSSGVYGAELRITWRLP